MFKKLITTHKKKIIILAMVILLGLLYGLGKQIYQSLQIGSRLDTETETLASLQKKNSELKNQLKDVETIRFIEGEARNKLNLARPNETVVIIPKEVVDKVLNSQIEQQTTQIPNWQGWLNLFWK